MKCCASKRKGRRLWLWKCGLRAMIMNAARCTVVDRLFTTVDNRKDNKCVYICCFQKYTYAPAKVKN